MQLIKYRQAHNKLLDSLRGWQYPHPRSHMRGSPSSPARLQLESKCCRMWSKSQLCPIPENSYCIQFHLHPLITCHVLTTLGHALRIWGGERGAVQKRPVKSFAPPLNSQHFCLTFLMALLFTCYLVFCRMAV